MDELEISGRPYLSAKRAAREHRYHSDYIGQLIRAKKVIGQKVGRSWYVDAASLEAYLKGEPLVVSEVKETTVVAAPPEPAPAPAEEASVKKIITTEPTPVVDAAEQVVSEREVTIIKEPHIDPLPAVAPTRTGLTFVADEEPLENAHALHVMPQYSTEPSENTQEVAGHESNREIRSGRGTAVVASFGIAALVLAIGSSYLLSSSVEIAGEQATASVVFGFIE